MKNNIEVRALRLTDSYTIQYLDSQREDTAEFFLAIQDILEEAEEDGFEQDYAYGVFENGRLVGYCSLGGADELHKPEGDLLLSDVFIGMEDRGKGYGGYMIKKVLEKHQDVNIWAVILDDSLFGFYEKLGFRFEYKDGGLIVKDSVNTLKHPDYLTVGALIKLLKGYSMDAKVVGVDWSNGATYDVFVGSDDDPDVCCLSFE